jgi:hypothetical protein
VLERVSYFINLRHVLTHASQIIISYLIFLPYNSDLRARSRVYQIIISYLIFYLVILIYVLADFVWYVCIVKMYAAQ